MEREQGSGEERDTIPQELERQRQRGPADYDESGGTGLEPQTGDAVIGGGVSGGDEDPIGEPGVPDEADADRQRPGGSIGSENV